MRTLDHPFILTGSVSDRDDDCACPDRPFLLHFDYAGGDVDTDCACPDQPFSLTADLASGENVECDCDCDCACADGTITAVSPAPSQTTYTQSASTHTTPLPHDFHLAFSPYAPGGPSVLNPAAWERWRAFAAPQPLEQAIDAELARQMLIHPAGAEIRPANGRPQTLTAWIHVTNACNLDCPYCYVRKSSARMELATGRRALDGIFATASKHGFRRVKLKYAGGEATLHFRLIRQLHHYATELAAQSGLELKEVALSNGVRLRPADADWLREAGVKLMISLDGIGELHNELRPLPSGAPFDTFHHVAHTIDEVLLPRGIRPDVTMTVTAVNAGGAADVAKWAMIERDLPTSFNFYRQNPLAASREDLALEESAIIEGMLAAYAVIEEELPERPFLDGLLDRVQSQAHTHTCGVGHSYLVVTHTGQLAQCQMHLEQPVGDAAGRDLLLPVQNGPLHNHSVHDKEPCRSCEFRYRCSGGCPLETYRATGRWDVKSPNCHIYKTLYPAALRLEGLRLMQANGYL